MRERARVGTWGRPRNRAGTAAVLGLALSMAAVGATAAEVASPDEGRPAVVAPVTGPSLLTRLKAGVDWTAFGRVGGIGTLPAHVRTVFEPSSPPAEPPGWWLVDGFVLSGADLYRLNCRPCHGVAAEGLAPVIPALLGPVRATSAEELQERMEERGRTISQGLAEKLASRAELTIRHRLLEGGKVMPPFQHLSDREVNALLGFLEVLAGLPPSGRAQIRLHQSAARVGEHIVKATCHICHDASPGAFRPAADRVLPSLTQVPEKYSVQEFVRKVREGSPERGQPRGRMPRFDYFRPEELSAAYVYLTAFRPDDQASR